MLYDQELEGAVASQEPMAALRMLVTQLTTEGLSQRAIYELFDTFRADLRVGGRDADEDVVLEVMDQIVGWCSPHVRLFPHLLHE